jgi:hypothetical protein
MLEAGCPVRVVEVLGNRVVVARAAAETGSRAGGGP